MEGFDGRILVVDDEEWILKYMEQVLEEDGVQPYFASSAEQGLETVQRYEIDVVLCDIRLHQTNGIEFLQRVRDTNDPPEVIMMTGYASIDGAVEAMRYDAFDYITKPLDIERVRSAVRRALDRHGLHKEIRRLRAQMLSAYGDERFVVFSKAMKRTLSIVNSVSTTDTTVLIEGESGTGKEIIARTIHRRSPRSTGPFIPVNCGALPDSLLESELFGYQKGAFTGATSARKGLFESAGGGTIFLDEIGELSYSVQATLLRVLQESEIRRLGSASTTTIDVRVIAATNKSLATLVKLGEFREDLYYRLRVVPIHVPPLRERIDDVLPLARYFMDEYSKRFGKSFRVIAPDAANFLVNYSWPGNVRELENLIHGIIALFDGYTLTMEKINSLTRTFDQSDSPGESPSVVSMRESESVPGSLVDSREDAERNMIIEALRSNDGHQIDTANRLGISRTSLWRKMKKYGLSPQEIDPHA